MRIASVHWGFPPIIGGVETHLEILLPELVKRGHSVGLLTGAAEGNSERNFYKGVDVFRSPLFDLNWLSTRGLDSLEQELLKEYVKFFDYIKPDIIHVHNMHYFSEVHTKVLESCAKKKGIPLILTAHNVWDDILFLKLTRDVKWDHIVAVSHYIKKELMGVGCSEESVTVIHHGIDVERFFPGAPNEAILKKHPELRDKRIIFHPARMGLSKGCDVSIKAINMVRKKIPNVMLVLAGTKNIIDWGITQQRDIAYFVDLIKTFDLESNVYIDCFRLDEMPDMYRLADLCIYPSTVSEPFGLTMLESLATAKPMIVSNMGGMPEIIRDDIDGYVVKVKDHEMLGARIVQILIDEELKNRLGNTGRQSVTKHYTKEIMTDSHEKLYQEILQ
ncbi:glycosyltransferase family 4 protein [bacterium]